MDQKQALDRLIEAAVEEIRAVFKANEGLGRTVKMYSQPQLDDIRASDREAIAKAARAWAAERCGQAFADELAELIRRGIAP